VTFPTIRTAHLIRAVSVLFARRGDLGGVESAGSAVTVGVIS